MSFEHVLSNAGLEPLGDKQLRAYAPAVFTREPHPDVSSRYGFIPTYKVVEALHKELARRDAGVSQLVEMLRNQPATASEVAKLKAVADEVGGVYVA